VRVGTVPDGATTEVYIAPQQSQKRKSKEKEKEKDQNQRGDTLSSLALLPDARSRTLEDLQLQCGEALRVAVDAETSFAAIIGSHIRVRFFIIIGFYRFTR
jgi:oxalate---CoA ligase